MGLKELHQLVNKLKADLIIDIHADEARLNPENLKKLIKFSQQK